MTPAFANEKLVIDLKAVLADIDGIVATNGLAPFAVSALNTLRGDIVGAFPWGYEAQKDLEEDRRRAEQGALAKAAEIAKEIVFK